MKTKLWALLGLTCALTVAQPALAAPPLRYDPITARDREVLIHLYVRTRWCMRDGTVAMLRRGSTDRDAILRFTVRTCGAPLQSELLRRIGMTNEESLKLLVSLADQSIDETLAEAAR